MYRILKLVLLAAAANCAPANIIPLAAPLPQPYFLIQPPLQTQYQYQPLLKFQEPQAPISKIEATKDQYVLLYPSIPTIPQIPLFSLRQSEGGSSGGTDYWQQINNWWNDFSSGFSNPSPAEEGSSSGSGSTDSKIEILMSDKGSENMQPSLPASTMPLNMNKRRFYIISQPQFYGNFAALQPAAITNPILAFQPRARSTVDSIPAENEPVPQGDEIPSSAIQPVQLKSNIVEAPDAELSPVVQTVQLRSNFAEVPRAEEIPPAVVQPLQLRSTFVEPLQRLEVDQPRVPVVNNEPVPGVAAQQLARFLQEARSQDAGPNAGNALNENKKTEEKPLEEETSIAQAKPSAIALSGKGGVSSSAPSATAVVGEGGLALASPSAIALSGEFKEEEEEKRSEPL